MAKENPWKEINDAFSNLCDTEGSKEVKDFSKLVKARIDTTTIFELETRCLICEESIPMKHTSDAPKICKKCKEAVMKVREQDGK